MHHPPAEQVVGDRGLHWQRLGSCTEMVGRLVGEDKKTPGENNLEKKTYFVERRWKDGYFPNPESSTRHRRRVPFLMRRAVDKTVDGNRKRDENEDEDDTMTQRHLEDTGKERKEKQAGRRGVSRQSTRPFSVSIQQLTAPDVRCNLAIWDGCLVFFSPWFLFLYFPLFYFIHAGPGVVPISFDWSTRVCGRQRGRGWVWALAPELISPFARSRWFTMGLLVRTTRWWNNERKSKLQRPVAKVWP